jgi:phosphoenolpyruvate-protein phosphotransferase (PTS system enzyme I)
MEIFRGIPVSPGLVIGTALVLDAEGVRIPARHVEPEQVNAEFARLQKALKAAADQSRAQQQSITLRLGKQLGGIFSAHAAFFDDPALIQELHQLVHSDRYSAEYAVTRVIRSYKKALEALGKDHFLATKATDLIDVEKKILNQLLGENSEPLSRLREPVIVLAHDLSPSETATMDPAKVLGFATESGGKTSHTAIMAGALEIPAVVGLGHFLNEVSGGDTVILDGAKGLLLVDPDEDTLRDYETQVAERRERQGVWLIERDLPAVTLDGVRIELMGNIELPQEAAHCVERNADGVGLYRTEFLFAGHENEPSEEDHYAAYSHVVKTLGPGKPVVIRTLDHGADKFPQHAGGISPERNPFLGLRSVRLCLRNIPLFKKQMRAILRASVHGDLRIMFPMVGTLLELRQCKMLLAEVREDLQEEGIPFNKAMPVGTMIEVPSAAIMADKLAKEVDFFSLGTNDLVQYTLAADRTNENVAGLYNPADPAVLRLIHSVVAAGRHKDIGVTVCGEMSGDPLFTPWLLGIGLRQLSVSPQNIPEIKKIIRLLRMSEAEQVAQDSLHLETARDVMNHLREHKRRIIPDTVD